MTSGKKSYFESGRVVYLPVHLIRPNPGQPRKVFEQQALQELSESIVQFGVLQPLTVRRRDRDYELVAGERRLRAARLAGLREVPCIVVSCDELESGMLALVENLQRRDLDYIEQAQGLERLMRLYGLSQEQAALRVGLSQSAIANKLRLLRHSEPVLAALREHHLTERHARALLRLSTEEQRLAAIQVIAARQMTVSRAEQYIEELLKPPARRPLGPFLVRDVRLFLNAVSHNLELMKDAGIPAAEERQETDREIVLTIRIPKHAG
ncbi:MAG: ParB/RepB/Spo0J family partition protein [Oscillospiraceae bacterium]|nr:ParB/RepB/Spo0J family partition protein [Oscillospiraceae bacterium]